MPESAALILDALPYPVYGIARNFQIVHMNRQAREQAGPAFAEGRPENSCYQTIYGRQSVCPYCPVLSEWRSDATDRAERTVHLTGEGQERVFQLALFNLRQAEPAIVEMLIDITEHKRLEEENLRKENLASLGTMVSGIAHELNNPLTGLNLTLQNLEASMESMSRESIAAKLQLLRKDLKRASLMVSDILSFSATGELKKMRSNLQQIIEKAILNIKRLYPVLSRQVDWRLEIKPGLFLTLNPQKIERLFINLFKNSIQALDYRSGYVRIEARAARRWAQVIVEDDAGGIPEAYLQRVFDPFFTRAHSGSGLGLSIAYNCVKEHNGRIRVSSENGKTKFTILLPAD